MSWFESWFDSPYYHILYQHRDEAEAEYFLDSLLDFLHPEAHSSMLDLACGKGRHSVYLNEKGYAVTGIDLSEQSIEYCKQFENKNLSFFVHDMRKLFRVNDFNYVFNLFTSFGYFDKETENHAAMKNACMALRKGGVLVIDFLNPTYVSKHLIASEMVEVAGIKFNIARKIKDGYFYKNIHFSDAARIYDFTEKVQALTLNEFEKYIIPNGMVVEHIFGDYHLNAFDRETSPRLILLAKKK
ncbi:MAG: class I SAM-dependent methyltransferase [Bacteroidetes bacterium]|nr:class I SAM-dependent methyltransferase [Bacteroidota bacterium]